MNDDNNQNGDNQMELATPARFTDAEAAAHFKRAVAQVTKQRDGRIEQCKKLIAEKARLKRENASLKATIERLKGK